jgi:predicted RNase H-like HicB family nuclease
VQYPIVIHKDEGSDYGITVPDLPGCFSAGETMNEALTMVEEAVELHLEGLMEEGMEIPDPTPIEQLKQNANYVGGQWAFVDVLL